MTVKQIIAGLESADNKQILKAIAALKSDGNHKVVKPLVNVLMNAKDDKISSEIVEILSSLKDSKVVDEMMDVLKDDTFMPIRQVLLSTIWNTQLDYSYYVADFVLFAAEGDFLVALDCLTILENMSGPFEERHVLEAQWHLKEWLESDEPKDDRKKEIMSDIAVFVKDADWQID